MRSIHLALITAVVLLIGAASVYPQTPATGIPPFATINIQNFDKLNVNDFNVMFSVAIARRPGRGASFDFERTYNSAFWTIAANGAEWYPNRAFNYGWNSNSNPVTGTVNSTTTWYSCGDIDNNSYAETTYDYVDPTGADHPFDYKQITSTVTSTSACPSLSTAAVMVNAQDGSGYVLAVDPGAGTSVVYDKHGTMYDNCHSRSSAGQCQATLINSNGNEITEEVIDATHVEWYDTVNGSSAPVLRITYTEDSYGDVQSVQYNVAGVSLPYTEKYTSLPAVSNPGCYLDPYTYQATIPYELDLPNGQTYTFAYDNEARVSAVKLPTGSTIHYQYGALSCYNDLPSSFSRWIDNGPARQYTQNNSNMVTTPFVVTETDPAGNQIQYSFNEWHMENQRSVYQGQATGGTLLRTIDTCYDGAASPCVNQQNYTVPIQEKSVVTTLDNGRQSRVNTYFDTTTYANVTEQDDYDFGASSPTRKTVNTYTGGNFPLLIDTKILNGSGTQIADTGYSYDQGSLQPSGVTTQLTTPASGIPRGNLTGVSQWVGGSQYLGTTHTYYDTGQLYSTTDPNQNTTYYFYDTAYAGAWLTRIQRPTTNGMQHIVSFGYDPATGLMTSSTDENGNVTRYTYADPLDRLTQITEPPVPLNGGGAVSPVTTISYGDQVGSLFVEVQKTIDTSRSTDQFTYFDSLGRPTTTCSANDEATPWDRVDTTWDAMDRVQSRSYPYQASDCTTANSEPGDTFAYDALGRSLSVTHSDGSQISYSYAGAATEVQDEGNGSSRVTHIYQNDGFGRLVSVCEVTSQTGAGSSSTPTACSNQIAGFPQDIAATGFETGYSYDLLGNLTEVQQPGLSPRNFTYDALSRLLSAANPEAGTTSYTYDGDGNVLTRIRPAPNQTNPAVTVTTSYSYDALNRVLSKTYSDGTTSSGNFAYDQNSADGISLADTIGRLSSESSGATAATFSYDALGRILGNSQCTPHNCGSGMFPITYTYDLVGDPTQVINGVGVGINQSWNRAQRLTGVTSSLVDSQHPATLLSNVHYGPFGPVSGTLGGVAESRGYTARGWLNSLQTGSLWSLNLGYQPDGTVASANDSVNGSWTYGYGGLNRLQTAACSSNCPGQAAGAALDLNWNYDRYGNRWSQAVTAGSAPTPSAPFAGGNSRMDGWSYDAAGDLLYDGVHHYSYDAEGRLISVDGGATASYVYDAEGRRVRRTTGTFVHDLLYDLDGHVMAEMEEDSHYNGWSRGEIYAGGRHLATYADSTTYFDHGDWLGTERLRTRLDGSLYETCVSLPYGDALNCTFPNGAGDDDPLHFTAKPRDSATGLDYFGARYNSSTLGRWMTPDEISGDGRDLRNPQDLNLYSYVWNNPVSLTDPTGQMVTVCVDNGYTCITMSDEEYAALYRQQNGQQGISMPGGNFPSGSITCGDQICGTVHYYEQGMEDQTAVLLSIEDLAGDAFAATAALTEGAAGAIGRFFGEATEQRTLVIGKMKDIGPETLAKGEYTLPGEGRLPNQGSPKANWLQNSTELRKEMSTRQPIRDASARPEEADGVPGQDTGFLSIERNLLRNHGWQYSDGYWYPPQ